MRKLCWVYQDRNSGDLVLVQRPYRRAVDPSYRVVAGVFKRGGFRPDTFKCSSVSTIKAGQFRERYRYLGGINTKGGR